MRISRFLRRTIFALSVAALSASAFAAKEGFTSLTANPGYGGNARNSVIVSSSVMYVATDWGGIIGTNNGGASWTPLNSGLKELNVRSIAVNLSNSNILYAATTGGAGFYTGTVTSAGAAVTWAPLPTTPTDGGLSCRSLRSMTMVNISGNTTNNGHIYVGTSCPRYSGVYKSENGGTTWAKVNVGLPDNVSVNSISPFGNSGAATIGARVASSAGVHWSTNLSTGFTGTWSDLTGNLPGVASASPNVFNAFTNSTGTSTLASVAGVGVFISSSGSSVWNQVLGSAGTRKAPFSGLSGLTGSSNVWVPIDGEGVYKSANFGATWAIDTAVPFGTNFMASASGAVWAFTTAGIHKSTDSGATFTKNTAPGQPGGYVTNVVADPTNSAILYAAGNTIYKSTDGGATWSTANSGLPYSTVIWGQVSVNSSGSQVWATTQNGGVFKSTDGGANWTQLPLLISGGTGPINGRIRISFDKTGAVYAAVGQFGVGSAGGGAGTGYYAFADPTKFGLYRSTDSGATWTTLLNSSVGSVHSASVNPSVSTDILVATATGIYRSVNGGSTWTNTGPGLAYFNPGVSTAGFSVTGMGVGAVRHDPLNITNVVATVFDVDNYNFATPPSGIYRSRDGGASWEAIYNNEKAGMGIGFGVLNGKSYMYGSSAGFYADATEFHSVHKCPSSTFFTADREYQECTVLTVGGTNDGVPVRANSVTIANGQLIGLATAGMGYQTLTRQNIGPDFNNDGVTDVLWRNTTAGGQNFIWRMQQTSGVQASLVHSTDSAFLPTVPTNWVVAGYGDFNGDGNTDILWRNTSTGDNYIYMMDGTTVLPSSGFILTVPLAWTVAGTGDFNGDGKADILWRNTATGDNYLYAMSGLTILGSSGYLPTVPLTWTVGSAGDFNGDGKTDILWRNTATGENYMYLMNGTVVTGQGYLPTIPLSWIVAGTRDLNGDSKEDIVWRNASGGGENYVYFMNGLTVLGSSGYLPTVADLTWQIQGVGNYADWLNTNGILWSNSGTRSNYLWKLTGNGLQLNGTCSTMATCDNASYLPSAPAGWAIVNK